MGDKVCIAAFFYKAAGLRIGGTPPSLGITAEHGRRQDQIVS